MPRARSPRIRRSRSTRSVASARAAVARAGVGVKALLLGRGKLVLGLVEEVVGPVEGGGQLLGVGFGVGQGGPHLLELAGDVGPFLGPRVQGQQQPRRPWP